MAIVPSQTSVAHSSVTDANLPQGARGKIAEVSGSAEYSISVLQTFLQHKQFVSLFISSTFCLWQKKITKKAEIIIFVAHQWFKKN